MNREAKILVKKAKKLEASGKFADAITAYEAALSKSPQNPDIIFALGNVAKKMDALPIAEQMFRTVYGLLPDSLEAATNLALVISGQDRPDEAIELFQALLATNPEHAGTWINLANTVLLKGDIENAEIFYREALRLKPGSVEALTNLAEIYTQKEDLDQALSYFDKALKRDKGNPIIRFNRSQVLLSQGNLKDGWREMDFGSQNRKDRKTQYHHKLKRWNGEDLAGKKILISCEQGIGDQVRLLHCLQDVSEMADKVVLEIDPRLVPILTRTYPDVEVRPFNTEKVANIASYHYDWPVNELDYASNALNLFKYFRVDLESFDREIPTFKPDPNLQEQWKMRIQGSNEDFKLGICWRGGKRSLQRDIHYADIVEWGPILNTADVKIYSLMYDDCADEIARAEDTFGCKIITFDDLDYRSDLEQVFALTNQMDIVIAANTSPASFAGVLGIPTYILNRDRGWNSLGQDYMPMVPAIKLIIQQEKGNWEPVIQEAADILQKTISQK